MKGHERTLIIVVRGELGGAQVVAIQEARALKEQGSNVLCASGPYGSYIQDQCHVYNIEHTTLHHLMRTYNPFTVLKALYELSTLIREYKPTTISLHSSNSLIAGLISKWVNPRTQVMFTFHGLSFLDEHHTATSYKKFLLRQIYRFFLKYVDTAYAITHDNYNKIIERNLISHHKLILKPVKSPPVEYLSREDARNQLSHHLGIALTDHYIIGTIGRLAYPKNQEAIINYLHTTLLSSQPNALCLIIGEGPDRRHLESLIITNNLSNNIYLLGEIPSASRYLKAFDLFILPSLYEGRSLSLMEARTANIPILASDIPGNREVLEGYEKVEWL